MQLAIEYMKMGKTGRRRAITWSVRSATIRENPDVQMNWRAWSMNGCSTCAKAERAYANRLSPGQG